MPDRAYLSVWCRNPASESMAESLHGLLETVPLSASQPGFASLVIRAVDTAQPPLIEHDLRGQMVTAGELIELARPHLQGDVALEAQAAWDLWTRDAGGIWRQSPQRLEVLCCGPEFDDALAAEMGHFRADLGLAELFTGEMWRADGAGTAERLALEKLRENVRKLFDWMRRIEATSRAERYLPWSEDDESFEARLDEILAAG